MSTTARKIILTVWEFPSGSTKGKVYQTLLYVDGSTSCDCPGWVFKRKGTQDGARTCKHTRFVDMGTADTHATGRKDYGNRRTAPERPAGRTIDLTE